MRAAQVDPPFTPKTVHTVGRNPTTMKLILTPRGGTSMLMTFCCVRICVLLSCFLLLRSSGGVR